MLRWRDLRDMSLGTRRKGNKGGWNIDMANPAAVLEVPGLRQRGTKAEVAKLIPGLEFLDFLEFAGQSKHACTREGCSLGAEAMVTKAPTMTPVSYRLSMSWTGWKKECPRLQIA